MQNKGIHFRKKSFGNLVKDYQKYRRPYDQKIYEQLFRLISKNISSLKILDLGCGSGKSTEPLLTAARKYKLEVVGYDHDEKMLAEAKSSATKYNLPITYMLGKAEKLPFDKSYFDVVIAGTAFHWFSNKKALHEICRVLKSKGIFFIFWKNPTTILDMNGEKVGRDVYKKFKCTSILGNWRDIHKVKKIFDDAGFKRFNTVTFSHEQKDSIDELIGGHRTNSKYAVLTETQKKSYIKQLTSAYKKALGNKKHFISMRETVVCYGYRI